MFIAGISLSLNEVADSGRHRSMPLGTITCTVPEQTFTNFTAVWNQTRYEYDDAGRETAKIEAYGLSEQRRTETTEAFAMGGQTYTTSLDYDDSGQLIEYTYPE